LGTPKELLFNLSSYSLARNLAFSLTLAGFRAFYAFYQKRFFLFPVVKGSSSIE
jgi:hypothetical protein